MVDIVNLMFQYPVITAKQLCEKLGLPLTSANRYLDLMAENRILFIGDKQRNRKFFYRDLLEIIR